MLEKYRIWQKPVIDKKKGKMRFDQKKWQYGFPSVYLKMEEILRNQISSNRFLGRLTQQQLHYKGRWSRHGDIILTSEAKLFRCPCGTVATFGWAPSVSTFGRCWTWHWLGLIDVEGPWFLIPFFLVIFVAANRYKENGKKRRKFKFWQLYSYTVDVWRKDAGMAVPPPYHVCVLYILSARFIFWDMHPIQGWLPLGA